MSFLFDRIIDMKITLTSQIEAFLDRCRYNIYNDNKNEFVGMHITKSNEKQIQQELRDAGFAEFQQDEENWPSLFISKKEWEQSPYHSNISLDLIKDTHFSYEKTKVAGRELFNVDAIQKDPNRELNDWMKLRAMDSNFESIYLYQDDQEWMLDAPSEAETNNYAANRAHGKVVTFGLGIGYFIYMALLNPNVEEVTVVENSEEVIAMFKRFLLPQFSQDKPVHFVQGDAKDFFNEGFLSMFDYSYTDIWLSSQDGLEIMQELLHQYNPPFEDSDFWIEDSCEEIMWTLIFMYFDAIAHNVDVQVNPQYEKEMQKIHQYFSNKNEIINEVDALKFYMYDTKTIREILSL